MDLGNTYIFKHQTIFTLKMDKGKYLITGVKRSLQSNALNV